MSQAMDKVMKARSALVIDQRFYGSLMLKLQLVEDTSCESMWVDGISLGFNPEWVNNLIMPELKGVMVHEVTHLANGHHLRRNGREMEDWNEGCDYAIDPAILESGFQLPSGGHINTDFDNQSAEGIYSIIQGKKQKKQEDNQQNESGKGSGKPQDDQQQSDQGQSEDPNGQQSPDDGQGQPDPNGKPQQGQGSGKPNPTGEVRDCPTATTETEKAQVAQEWQVAVAQAAQAAEGCGQMEGNLKEFVACVLDPKVPWQEVLQRFMDQVANNDYSFARPNVRYGSSDIIMPSLYNRELPPIDILLDTSGSITKEDKKQFVAEINDIRGRYRTTLRLIHCDTSVRHVDIIEPDDEFTSLETFGGGGTKFSPAIAWSQDNEDQPCAAIYLTDMDCSDYGPEPDFPVLWIDTRGSRYTKRPPFGEYVPLHHRQY